MHNLKVKKAEIEYISFANYFKIWKENYYKIEELKNDMSIAAHHHSKRLLPKIFNLWVLQINYKNRVNL